LLAASEIHLGVMFGAFAAYTLLIIGIGLWSSVFARRSDEDYFLAGRSLNPWIAALSASASSESGWVTLGLVGWAFTQGVMAYWIIPGCLLGYAFNWFFLAARISDRSRALNALTLPDFFAFNFREKVPILRTLAVIVILTAMLLYVAAQLSAAGKAFGVVLEQVETQTNVTLPKIIATPEPDAPAAAADPRFVAVDAATAADPAAATEETPDQLILSTGYPYGVLIGAVIVLLYTVSGGFRAVCWTDFLQALLMVGTLVIFPLYLLATSGGYAFITTQLNAASPDLLNGWPTIPDGAAPMLAVGSIVGFLFGHGALGINFGYPGQPHVLVRFMALKKRQQAWIGGIIAITWGLLVYWGAVTVGLYARAMAQVHAEDPTQAAWTTLMSENADVYGELGLVLSAAHLLPAVLSGLVLAAVLAAICSTVDSQLVVAASAAANDFYTRIIRRGRESGSVWVNRGTTLALGVAAVLIVFEQEVRVYEFVLQYGWAILGAAFGPQVALAVLWKRASYAGAIAGMLTGFVVPIVWQQIYHAGSDTTSATWLFTQLGGVEIYNLPLAFVLALVINVLVSLATPGGRAIDPVPDAAPDPVTR
jgi:sodium/proline symporter